MFAVPEEIEQLIWQTYVRLHVLPCIPRHGGLARIVARWAKRFRSARADHPDIHHTALDVWIEWISCHVDSFSAFLDIMTDVPGETTCVYADAEGFERLLWMIDDSHGFSVSQHARDRLFVSYHTPERFESALLQLSDENAVVWNRRYHRLVNEA